MNILCIALMVFVCLWVGDREGRWEALLIDAQKPIHHFLLWIKRFVFVGIPAVVLMLLLGDGWPPQGIDLIFLLGIAWGVVAPTHRLTLNSRREKGTFPWNYVSPSNAYDRAAIRLVWWAVGWMPHSPDVFDLKEMHKEYWRSVEYRRLVHTAGKVLYCFEGAVLLTSSILLIHAN